MNRIKRKLRSKTGATMILALVFLMFCLFVGGSVMAAAAANSYRAKRVTQQQDQINTRSAALLVAQELASGDGAIQLTVSDITKTVDGATPQRTVTISLPANTSLTPMQRIAVETTVWQFLRKSGATSTAGVTLVNFPTDMDTMVEFWYQYSLTSGAELSGTVELSGPVTGSKTQAYFTNHSEAADLYDFSVTFGADSQVHVEMEAYHQTKTTISSTLVTESSTTVTQSTQTVILLDDPVVEKGA